MSADELKAEMLREIEEFYRQDEIQPGDVTATEIARSLKVCEQTARDVMKKLVATGRYVELSLIHKGHKQKVYRKATQK